MPTASVRLALLAATAMYASGSVVAAQANGGRPSRLGFGVALGTTVLTGYVVAVPGDFGLHAQLGGLWHRSARLAFRGDVSAGMLSGAVAEPSCVPGSVCRGFAIHPDQVYSDTLSAEFRPLAATPRLFGLAGGGVYHARGPESTNFGTTLGASGGLGIDLAPAGHAGLSLEAKYHYVPNAFGTLHGMFMPSLAFRF